jgi:hypothetical protein
VRFAQLTEEIFRALPIVTLAFACQFNLLPIVAQLKAPVLAFLGKFLSPSLSTHVGGLKPSMNLL